MNELNWPGQIGSSRSNQRSNPAAINKQLEELQNNSQEPSTGDPYSERNDHEPNLPHQISLSQSERHRHAAATTNQPFGLLGQQEELQNNSQPCLATSFGDPYSQRNDSHYESYLLSPESYSWSNGRQEESQNNSLEGQYPETFVREPHSQRNEKEANWLQYLNLQQSDQLEQTSLGTTSTRAGSLIPSQAVEVTEQLLGQSRETSTPDCQNIGKFSEEDRQRLKDLQKKKRKGHLSQEEEPSLQALVKKRKKWHDSKYRQKKKDNLEEKDRIIQQLKQHEEAEEAVKRELQRQLEAVKRESQRQHEERAKTEESLESKIKELYEVTEQLTAENRSLKVQLLSANGRAQDISRELAEFGNLRNDDEQPNVTLPESMQTQSMEVAEIQKYQYDELEQRNQETGRTRRKPSTREQDTVDEESNSQPNSLCRLFKGLKSLKNNYLFSWTTR